MPEDYVHRIGRTGRAGATGIAVSLVSPDEGPLLRDIEKVLGGKRIQEMPLPKFAAAPPDRRPQPAQQSQPQSHQGRPPQHASRGRPQQSGRSSGGGGNSNRGRRSGARSSY